MNRLKLVCCKPSNKVVLLRLRLFSLIMVETKLKVKNERIEIVERGVKVKLNKEEGNQKKKN